MGKDFFFLTSTNNVGTSNVVVESVTVATGGQTPY